MANDFFKNVKKQELENKENKKIEEKVDSPKIDVPKVEEPKPDLVQTIVPPEAIAPTDINSSLDSFLPQKGRPKEFNGNKHQLCLQMREDFYELARKKAAKEFNNSVTRYIHYLIAKDHGLL